ARGGGAPPASHPEAFGKGCPASWCPPPVVAGPGFGAWRVRESRSIARPRVGYGSRTSAQGERRSKAARAASAARGREGRERGRGEAPGGGRSRPPPSGEFVFSSC